MRHVCFTTIKGECIATYNKIHLFDVDLPEKGESYRESSRFQVRG